MKKAVYWLMGERGAKATLAVWNLLWGISEEVPKSETDAALDNAAIATAEASFNAMQTSVEQLAQATHQQSVTYEQAKAAYFQKLVQLKRAEEIATNALLDDRQHDLTVALNRVVQLKELLPLLQAQMKQAEAFVQASQRKLWQERSRLENYRSDLKALKNLTEVNEALTAIVETHNEADMASARAQFEAAKDSVYTRYLETQAFVDLSVKPVDNPVEVVDAVARQKRLSGD